MTTPAVSVLIPVYNVEALLPRCLDSVLAQTFQDFEIVCVNDCSPDGSLEVLKQYAAKDSRVRIIDKPQNEGLMLARKTGYKSALGKYFFFLDSDDYIPADTLEILYNEAEKKDADLTPGQMTLVNTEGREVFRPRASRAGRDRITYLKSILHWNSPSLCGTLFNRRVFEGKNFSGRLHQSFSEDRILLTEILLSGDLKIAPVEKNSYYYWMNTASITRRKITRKDIDNQFEALFYCYDIVEKSGLGLTADNKNFIARYLGLYIEKGADAEYIRNYNELSRELLKFSELRRYTSFHFALHTVLCMRLPGYRPTLRALRLLIRKIQGKD